jgi:uncharacterized protein
MRLAIVSLVASLFLSSAATAAPVTIASAAQGSVTYNMALAIAGAASANSIDLRPQPYKSTTQGTGFVNSGEIDFGLENAVAIRQAMVGEGPFAGAPLSNLRLVARLIPLRMAIAVRKDSGIASIADLAGKRMPAGFKAAPTGELLISTMLSTGGLSYDDVQKVQTSDFTAMTEAFVAGDLDAMIHVVGSPRDEQVARDVGGIDVISLGSDAAAVSAAAQRMPVGSLATVDPAASFPSIVAPITILQYDYYLYTSAEEDDANVVALIEALKRGKEIMVSSVAGMIWFDPAAMHTDIGLPYHPAAETYYAQANP